MSVKNSATGYGSVSRFFHWLIFLLVLVMIPLGYFMGDFPKEWRGAVVNVHKVTGVCILILMLLRLLWALCNVKPLLPFQTPVWQRIAERVMQFLLYAGLIIMPLAGLVGSVAAGKPPHFFDINIVLPIAESKALAAFCFDVIHNNLAIILIVLISIHMLAALYHHFIKRDDVLRRMWTGGERRYY
jgi:cytochrome b561